MQSKLTTGCLLFASAALAINLNSAEKEICSIEKEAVVQDYTYSPLTGSDTQSEAPSSSPEQDQSSKDSEAPSSNVEQDNTV